MTDSGAMLVWAESVGWQRYKRGEISGHRRFHGGRWCFAADHDIGMYIVEYPPWFLATYFRGIAINHRSWMN
jgi:hypothetical protein